MLYRKIQREIEQHFTSNSDKILVIEGARQVGKSYIIRELGKRLFKHFVEINLVSDDEHKKLFRNIHSTDQFYLQLSSIAGDNLGDWTDTLVFIDEIQHYPQFLTMLKFFREEHKFRFIASGSLLGIALRSTTSIPVGSIIRKPMYQLDFEEFLIANNYGVEMINYLRDCYENNISLTESQHNYLIDLLHRYLLVGGMPDAVNEYLSSHNIARVREVQDSIMSLYKDDASKYEVEAGRKMMIRKIYDIIVSQMENKKKRIVARDIQNKKGDRFERYFDDFEYLQSSGIALAVNAISNPKFPLTESLQKNLVKFYLNDVGLLTGRLYKLNIQAILGDERSVNLGSVYESVVAQELKAHGYNLFYYDNRTKGEVDFIIDDYMGCSVCPIEVKSGRDYYIHSALNNLIGSKEYNVKRAVVLSNERVVKNTNGILYLPIYYVMFINVNLQSQDEKNLIF